jgi:hypothetical protein
LFAKVVSTEGISVLLTPENGIVSTGAYHLIDLSNCTDTAYIELFVVQKNNKGQYDPEKGVKLSWERISVVADGLNGGKFEASLYPEQITVPLDGQTIDAE